MKLSPDPTYFIPSFFFTLAFLLSFRFFLYTLSQQFAHQSNLRALPIAITTKRNPHADSNKTRTIRRWKEDTVQQSILCTSHGKLVNPIRMINCVIISVCLVLMTSCATVQNDSQKVFANNGYLESSRQLYEIQPNIAACKAGILNNSVRERVLEIVNRIRGLHGLSAVSYSKEYESEVMEAALMMAANGQLSHSPPSSWKCYSAKGASGAGRSNIHGGMIASNLRFLSPEEIVIGWLTDVGNASGDNVGHRRWLLDPFLQNISFGMVSGQVGSAVTTAAALRVIWDQPSYQKAPPFINDFVAYPFNDYPENLFDKKAIISFSALAGPGYKHDNRADYSKATVRVSDENGKEQAIFNISSDSDGFGIPNAIQFSLRDIEENKKYIVHIDNVYVGKTGAAVPKNYSYWFRII